MQPYRHKSNQCRNLLDLTVKYLIEVVGEDISCVFQGKKTGDM